VLAPGRPERTVQFIDVRDLARWTIDLVERGAGGVFNTVGPATPLTMADLLAAIATFAGVTAECVWVDDAWLLSRGVQPWTDLPLWIPETPGNEMAGMLRMDNRRAVSAGIRFRPAVETARDILALDRARWGEALAAGMSAEKERELLGERSVGNR
jgi:2'-hydroxyisoflavone reductase